MMMMMMMTRVVKRTLAAATHTDEPSYTAYALKHMLTHEYYGYTGKYEPRDADARTWPTMTEAILFLDTDVYLPERHRWNAVPVRRAGEAPVA
jgi:hypothetical protein